MSNPTLISQTLDKTLSHLQPLKEAQPSTASEVFHTFVCIGCDMRKQIPTTDRYGHEEYGWCSACRRKKREAKFVVVCPRLYQDTDPSRLPKEQMERIMQWQFGPRGLALVGDTGKGKSRAAWMLLKRVLIESERNFVWFDCVGFGHAIAKHYKDDDAESWLEGIAGTELLFFDDLGKLKLTERAETELFGVIERRCANQLPIIATTNDSGDSLAARMTENRGPALIRRLREFCDVISF